MNNFSLWGQILQRLRNSAEYTTGAIITLPESLGGETRCYSSGAWFDNDWLGLFESMDVPQLTLADIFPESPESLR